MLVKHIEYMLSIPVLMGDPVFAGSGIVTSIDLPLGGNLEMITEVGKNILRRHDSASEKVFRHPIILRLRLKEIRKRSMAKNVNK